MEKYVKQLKNCNIFENISEEDISSLLYSAQYYVKNYKKGEVIIHEDDYTRYIGVILDGEVAIYQDDMDGNSFLRSKLSMGESFGYILSITSKKANNNVVSQSSSTILFLNIYKLLDAGSDNVKVNLIHIIADIAHTKSVHISLLSLKTLRKKILYYLVCISDKENTWFKVSLNRQQMSSYLGINRSSLSKELTLLKKEGIIDYKKNSFIILDFKYIENNIL